MSPTTPMLSRRRALQLLSANIALITAGCGKPHEEILPYVDMPERVLPGVPLSFATTLPLGGYGRGVICTSVEGRPIKVSGNPAHPASGGATDVYAEAHVLSLYDPERSQVVRRTGEVTAYQALETALTARRAALQANGGEGFYLVTGPLSSPTSLRLIAALRQTYSRMVWAVDDPLQDRAAKHGARRAFGTTLRCVPRLAEADMVVCLAADPLGPGPHQIVNAAGFAAGRRLRGEDGVMSRWYAIESVPTVTGAKADHRLALAPHRISNFAFALAARLGLDMPQASLEPVEARLLDVVVKDIGEGRRAIVLAGPSQPSEVHALAHAINQRLKAPVTYIKATEDAQPLAVVAEALAAGKVDSLLFSDCNPIYDASPALAFDRHVAKVPETFHHGLYVDETAESCGWHIPAPHALESWGDLESYGGATSLVQPLIAPLYDVRSFNQVLNYLLTGAWGSDYDLVRATWQPERGADFEQWWRIGLQRGVLADVAPHTVTVPQVDIAGLSPPPAGKGLQIILSPGAVYDGGFGNNAWLQECPDPLTKQVWGNALGLSSSDAEHLGLRNGDAARIKVESGEAIEVPVRVEPAYAEGTMRVALGYGRTGGGSIASGVGGNAYRLRGADADWLVGGARIEKVSGPTLVGTQHLFQIEGDQGEIFPVQTIDSRSRSKGGTPKPSLLPRPSTAAVFAKWAMVVDNAACIGCNACVLACQVENNVPVVGPEEIANERDMHWLRIDAYELDEPGRMGFEPVPCMHCETAPCEPVCPVGASMHDSEGLNVQVYNRCVGTRFCEANCPYKVRRFNFFGYAQDQAYRSTGGPTMAAHNNPNVTVRARGVMEKCTFCVQRISDTRRRAEREGRPLRRDEVTTACQDACPTRAFSFGDLQQADAEVTKRKDDPRHFTLLEKLNTKPRTTYLADLRNPHPHLEGKG